MALFNSKEPEKNLKPQAVLRKPPVHSAPTPPAVGCGRSEACEHQYRYQPHAKPNGTAMPSTTTSAYLDAGSKHQRQTDFETPARIDGQVDGEINAKDSLTIGESAVVAAQIKADSVIVAGKVSGDIVAVHRIEIRPSAKVLGNITAPTLVINEGALFEGHCAMRPRRMTIAK